LDVDSTSLSGTWWRQIPAGGDVHYEPLHPADNRWQRGAVVEALYFADEEATVWAEWYRYLAEAGLPPQQSLPRDLWRWEISLSDVADLTDEDRLARVGLPALEPTRHQWPTFQPVGEQLHSDGWPALVSCSAGRPESRVLCVFRTAREVPGIEPAPPPTTVGDPPVVPTGMRT
jgi:hypothetical protein